MTTLVMKGTAGEQKNARLMAVLPLAGAITLALFLLMRWMVSMPIVLSEAEERETYDINPIVKPIPPNTRKAIPERIKDVTPPPPPPRISNQTAKRPDEAIAKYTIPDLNPPAIQPGKLSMVVTDRDARPLVRIEPVYPPRAIDQGKEGVCEGLFDVSAIGKPYNVRVTCSSPLFVRAATRAIEKWKYNPKIVDGKAVIRRGLVTPFKFTLAN